MSRKKKLSKEQPPEAASADTEQQPAKPISLQDERDDLLGRLQRVSADYLNYQKRVQRDITQAREYANDELIKALLGVLDDMERSLEAARANHDPEDPLLTGMELVHDKALETLGKFGLERIEAIGKPFDPEEHSAMMQESSTEHPPQTVLRELQRGYRLKGRTLRPSAVIVSKAPDDQAPESPQEQESADE